MSHKVFFIKLANRKEWCTYKGLKLLKRVKRPEAVRRIYNKNGNYFIEV